MEDERTSMRRAVLAAAHTHHHVVTKAHDRRARHRLDAALADCRRVAPAGSMMIHLRLVTTASAALYDASGVASSSSGSMSG